MSPTMLRRIARLTALFAVTTVPAIAHAAEPELNIRTYNPFTAIFGRPETFGARTLTKGTWTVGLTATITSHTEPALPGVEALELDGESHQLSVSIERGVSDRWQLGARIPYLSHSGGFMDAIVENWHDIIGAPNDQRDVRPRDQLNFSYSRDGEPSYSLVQTSRGLGDIELRTRYRLLGARGEPRRLALYGGLKLPTGSPESLRGSGAADLSIGVGYSDRTTLAFIRTTLSAHAGVLLLGAGEVLPTLQKDLVPFGGLQLSVAAGRRVDLIAQLQASGAYYESGLSTLGAPTVQLSFAANVRFPERRWELSLGIVEDAFSDMMPDFALHLALRKHFAP